ncbi:PHP domain-containing protein [Pumilibacter intestinalis]|uniref:PHP domain-containing protein n=1 Tax=Pumilibacter intestinalis TaxID=2941511 RepID=UPI00203DCB18|nr:PHP domain-containing protein [Pumilibacter intestinalis]
MAFLGDYHTHTVYSHGKGLIEHNVLFAVRRALKEVAIADHGFSHMAFGVKRRKLPQMRREIELLEIKYPQVRVYLGVEANIISRKGKTDVKSEDKPKLDITVCGYHKFVAGMSPAFAWSNNLGFSGAKTVARNTEAYVNAIERNEIDILSHPGNFCKCDVREVARACKHFGTYFELNGKRIFLSDDELAAAAQEGCEFICNSDAHTPKAVGMFAVPLERIERVGIPFSQIANYDRLPSFRSSTRKEGGKEK